MENRNQHLKTDIAKSTAIDWKAELLCIYPEIGDSNLARICDNDLAQHLVEAIKMLSPNPNEGCPLDPLVILLPDIANQDSLTYFNQGNYGLQLGAVDGGLALPIPPYPMALQPPNAFGRFIAGIAGFTDRSHGRQILFHCPDWVVVYSARDACSASEQFRRLGPVVARMVHGAGAVAQSSFVTALIINDLRSNPTVLTNFNSTP